MRIRHSVALVILSLLVACGGGSSSPAPAPTPTPVPTDLWTVNGRVTALDGGAVAGATVTPEGGTAVQTDANGAYKISGTTAPAGTPFAVTVDAPGYVKREVQVRYQAGTRNGVDISLIRDAAPFSLDFYRQLARNSFETTTGALELIWRLETNPSIYVRTVDQNGRAIEPEVLRVVLPALRQGVTDWSTGKLSVTTLETGTETRPRTDGWIMVNILRDRHTTYCGRAWVGATDGQIELVDDRCSCGSTKISGAVVVHEVGHSLGFFHVKDRTNLMYPYVPGDCPPGTLSQSERYHAGVAYARTRGNADPDADHPSAQMAMPGGAGSGILIEN